ncbi:MAG TPA: hypothetical protein VFW06_08060 [Acidimicrobiia bacterium]|nr:hypothetical protein [Acidimicrobiia bacterium]
MTDTPEPVEIESRIARDLAKKAAIAAPILVVGIGAWRGVDAGAAVALAFAVVVANFLASAALLAWTARRTPELLMGVAMMSFIGRLVLITAIGVGIKALDIVDWPVFCITLVVGYLGLLFWEMRSISLSLASPGLKPRPSTHAGVDR